MRLVNPYDKLVNLGNLPINKTISKRVPVINEGRAALELRFDFTKRLPGFESREGAQKDSKKTKSNSKLDLTRASITETQSAYTDDLQTEPDLSEVLEIEPAGSIVLRPSKIVHVIIKYKPTRKMCPFVAQVAYQTAFTIQPLFTLRGSCIGNEFCLSRNHLSFKYVAQNCLEGANSQNFWN